MKAHMKLELLMNEINANINTFEERSKKHKKKAYFLKLSSIIGSAVVTVLLGLKSLETFLLSDLALILSAFVTIFNGIEGFYNHRGLWIKDVKTLASLTELRRDLEFYITGEEEEQLSIKILTRYKERLQYICNEDVKTWTKMKEDQSIADTDDKAKG